MSDRSLSLADTGQHQGQDAQHSLRGVSPDCRRQAPQIQWRPPAAAARTGLRTAQQSGQVGKGSEDVSDFLDVRLRPEQKVQSARCLLLQVHFLKEGCGTDNLCRSKLKMEYALFYKQNSLDAYHPLPM